MTAQKISISLDREEIQFLQAYQERHAISSRSEVVGRALHALRDLELQQQYREAMQEHAASGDAALWDTTSGDGITTDGADAAW